MITDCPDAEQELPGEKPVIVGPAKVVYVITTFPEAPAPPALAPLSRD